MSGVNTAGSPFEQSWFQTGKDKNRVVQGGENGSKVIQEGNSEFSVKKELGKNDFLNLLVTQLKYQDPMNPSNDQEFVAQLAQFSNLESSQNIEKSMTNMAKSMELFTTSQSDSARYMGNSSAANLLGTEARLELKEFGYAGYGEHEFQFVKENVGTAYAKITDQDGKLVLMEVIPTSVTQGELNWSWSGNTQSGSLASPGKYNVELVDAGGLNSRGYAFSQEMITGISYKNNEALLATKSGEYKMENLKQVVIPSYLYDSNNG
jgi:flagellar basal-body rod modification protein FlgD